MDLGLKDVHVLVTGASGGIGLETAKLYLNLGANVTAHYNSNPKPIQILQESYPALQCVRTNLSSESAVTGMFEVLSGSSFGPVAVVVVNHGVWPPEDVPIVDMTTEQWDRTISANLTSSFFVCREYLRQLRESVDGVKDKASIVLIGSTAGEYGEANHIDYAASKSAMMYGMTMTLKYEIVKIAPKGRVNCIAPGWVLTPMTQETLNNPVISEPILSTTPLKKFATPLDIANQIVVLSSSVVSGHVTGQIVLVEGGNVGN